MKKYIQISTKNYPLTEQDVREHVSNVSIPVIEVEASLQALGFVMVEETPQPIFNTATETTLEVAPKKEGDKYVQVWSVVALTPEQIAAKAEQDARIVANKMEELWRAANSFTMSYISGVAVGILSIGVMTNKPKCLAVAAWSKSVWDEYYARKALVTVNSVDNLDFTTLGLMPYSVPELSAEVGM